MDLRKIKIKRIKIKKIADFTEVFLPLLAVFLVLVLAPSIALKDIIKTFNG